MDAKLYSELSQDLQKKLQAAVRQKESAVNYLNVLTSYINQKLATGQNEVCEWGSLESGGRFQPRELEMKGHDFKFALRIAFYGNDGTRILEIAIPCNAHFEKDYVVITCDGRPADVRLVDMHNEHGFNSVLQLLDGPIRAAVARARYGS